MSAAHDLRGRRALVTGASSGVGEAVARQLAAAGARVVVAARRADRLQHVADEIGAIACPADVATPGACVELVESAVAALGGLDVLINNAGAHHRGDFADQSAAHLATMVDVNLRAPVVLSRAALPHLRAAARGAIVNVGSVAGRMPVPGSATYSATKAGLRTLTYALAEECRGTRVCVSVVSPGPIATDFILADIDAVTDLTFSQPMSTPEQIADLVLDCIADGRVERTRPTSTRIMTTLGSLFPALPRALRPVLAAKGRRAKARYRRGG
ncbi:SDR family oxidoreductase [Salinisphaera sp. LB1]|uniref:SDR family NAD(P)-dependent oxidoreductase n=1 Tax=Salinisphaera sp. LB1 TaxID=2183911 RepID=UPI000D70846C|nr:SDR family NAD(P)-dependent oxidoreductase [Salinisphaera sp. LB1]AWN16315.1 oxidoreductase, short-chain dehydrogenase/reductase family [Salinisphaera sp. LB1]